MILYKYFKIKNKSKKSNLQKNILKKQISCLTKHTLNFSFKKKDFTRKQN